MHDKTEKKNDEACSKESGRNEEIASKEMVGLEQEEFKLLHLCG